MYIYIYIYIYTYKLYMRTVLLVSTSQDKQKHPIQLPSILSN